MVLSVEIMNISGWVSWSLLADIDLITGKVSALVSGTYKDSDFIEFLKILDVKDLLKSQLSDIF